MNTEDREMTHHHVMRSSSHKCIFFMCILQFLVSRKNPHFPYIFRIDFLMLFFPRRPKKKKGRNESQPTMWINWITPDALLRNEVTPTFCKTSWFIFNKFRERYQLRIITLRMRYEWKNRVIRNIWHFALNLFLMRREKVRVSHLIFFSVSISKFCTLSATLFWSRFIWKIRRKTNVMRVHWSLSAEKKK